MPTKPRKRLDPWYVTGLVDGEGCFTYSRSGPRLTIYFALKTPGPDRGLLAGLRRYFGGAGVIYDLAQSSSYYRVCRKRDLDAIVAHFDAYPLRGRKRASFRIWREMVLLKRQTSHPPRDRLDALAARLSASSARSRSTTPLGERISAVERDHLPTRSEDGEPPLEPEG